ncbi:MAG: tRNA threonylcarbamoyladenosine dehydratase [Erysipelotrichaceae bacterium]|nr:tRNA threonylcarbamoyladenosine dehydratase [Erysipelotrichaceae bacterium]
MSEALERMKLLIHEEGIQKLKNTSVMVVGIGGVGSYSAEALARCGIGRLILVDGDEIALSNLNRQIHATFETVGRSKTTAMHERIKLYRDDCEVLEAPFFYSAAENEKLLSLQPDYIIDAIDTVTCKADLIEMAYEHGIPFISSLGMANRFDPTMIEITDLWKTNYDPLAKAMRSQLRKRGVHYRVPVLFSKEPPFVQRAVVDPDAVIRKVKMPPASTPFVPSAAGLAAASYIVRKILKHEKPV